MPRRWISGSRSVCRFRECGTRRHRLESRQRQALRLAQIGRAELTLVPPVGFPIPISTSIASPLTARGELAGRGAKAERAGGLKPDIPGFCADTHELFVSLLLILQGVVCDDRCMSGHGCAPLEV